MSVKMDEKTRFWTKFYYLQAKGYPNPFRNASEYVTFYETQGVKFDHPSLTQSSNEKPQFVFSTKTEQVTQQAIAKLKDEREEEAQQHGRGKVARKPIKRKVPSRKTSSPKRRKVEKDNLGKIKRK